MSNAASPAASEAEKKVREVPYKFCPECSNLLYAKENRQEDCLEYVCKTCHHHEPSEPTCTERKEYGATASATAGTTTDVANDPTLPRTTQLCPRCKGSDAVYFQSQQRAHGNVGMKNYYVCLDCNHVYTIV